jgi:hypothetical protein
VILKQFTVLSELHRVPTRSYIFFLKQYIYFVDGILLACVVVADVCVCVCVCVCVLTT